MTEPCYAPQMGSGRWSMKWTLFCVLALGCGGSARDIGTGGAGPLTEGNAGGTFRGDLNAGSLGGRGGAVGSIAIAGGGAAGTGTPDGDGTSGASVGIGGYGGAHCIVIQQQAQQAADTSCSQDSDCEHPPHMAGDCLECGAVTNVASEQSSLEAVRSVCQRFYDEGCQYPLHSCPAQRLACIAGACK